jgi:hypothetical protein
VHTCSRRRQRELGDAAQPRSGQAPPAAGSARLGGRVKLHGGSQILKDNGPVHHVGVSAAGCRRYAAAIPVEALRGPGHLLIADASGPKRDVPTALRAAVLNGGSSLRLIQAVHPRVAYWTSPPVG